MQHLTTKSFFQRNNIDSEEDKNLNFENINYISDNRYVIYESKDFVTQETKAWYIPIIF